jgi:hypothetical protein
MAEMTATKAESTTIIAMYLYQFICLFLSVFSGLIDVVVNDVAKDYDEQQVEE